MTASSESMPPGVLTLVPERLYALCNAYALDGLMSTHPRSARGYSSMNCYVLVEQQDALLLDTGMSIHQRAILAQLEALLGNSSRLSILPVRSEFSALCNVRPIADRYPLGAIHGRALGEPWEWLDFRPGFEVPGGGLVDVPAPPVWVGGALSVDADGARRLEILSPPIRLLPGMWAYDSVTATLFTADLFTWIWRTDPGGPWLVQAEADTTTADDVRDFLVENRYWWLAGARTERLRRDLADVFDRHDVVRIAPGYGCVIDGRDAVARQYDLLDGVLARLAHEPSVGVSVSRRPLRTAS